MTIGTKFAVGDIVKLKAGGPDMAVKVMSEKGNQYTCQWFAGKKLEQGTFPGDSLERVKPEGK